MCFIQDSEQRSTSKNIYEGSFFRGYVPFLQNAPMNKIIEIRKVEFSNNLHETGHFCAYINHSDTISSMDNFGIYQDDLKMEDPPLSKLGIAQSIYTGRYLKQYFFDKYMYFDKIKIRSSPFIKNLMTACFIAKEMGIPKVEVDSVLVDT